MRSSIMYVEIRYEIGPNNYVQVRDSLPFALVEVLIFSLGFSVLRSSSVFILECMYGTYRVYF